MSCAASECDEICDVISVDREVIFSDILHGRGDSGESIFGETFEDETFAIPHNRRGILGMANKGRHTNASQFYVTLQPTPWMDCKFVAFGWVDFT